MVAAPSVGGASFSEAPSELALSKRYEALIRVSQAIGAHRDPKDLFRAMAPELQRVVQFDGIVVSRYDEASNEILWKACDVSDQQGVVSRPEFPGEESITKWVYERQETLVISSLDQETRFPRMISFLKEKGYQSVCFLPLATAHRRIGSIGVASSRAGAYCKEEVRFLSLVADQVALAIDDALNFQASQIAQTALQHKNERLKLLLEINNQVVTQLYVNELFRSASASIRKYFANDFTGFWLIDKQSNKLELVVLDFPGGKGFLADIPVAALTDQDLERMRTRRPEIRSQQEIEKLPPAVLERLKAESIATLAVAPLGTSNGPFGFISMGSKRPDKERDGNVRKEIK